MAPQFNPPSFINPQKPDISNSIDSIFNQYLQAKQFGTQQQQMQQQIALQQLEAQGQFPGIDLATLNPQQIQQASRLVNNPQIAPQIGQGQGIYQNPGQPIIPQNLPPNVAAIVQGLHMIGQSRQLGVSSQIADVKLKEARAGREQNIADTLSKFNTNGGPGQPTEIPGIRQFNGPQGQLINAQVNPESGKIETEVASGTQPAPAEITSANSLIQAKNLSDQLLGAYNRLAAAGKVGKLKGTWNSALASFTGGSTDPDVLAFQNAAEGLVGNLKGPAGEPSRVPQNIINRLDRLFANPSTAPEAVKQTHDLLNQSIDQSLLIHSSSYPSEAARIARVQKAQSDYLARQGARTSSGVIKSTDANKIGRFVVKVH